MSCHPAIWNLWTAQNRDGGQGEEEDEEEEEEELEEEENEEEDEEQVEEEEEEAEEEEEEIIGPKSRFSKIHNFFSRSNFAVVHTSTDRSR